MDLASDQVDLRLVCRRLAQLEVQLTRLADAAELFLKLEAIKANVPLSALKEAVAEATEVPSGSRPPVEVLQQSQDELDALQEAYDRAEERFGKGRVPASLDLYAEVEKMREGDAREEP